MSEHGSRHGCCCCFAAANAAEFYRMPGGSWSLCDSSWSAQKYTVMQVVADIVHSSMRCWLNRVPYLHACMPGTTAAVLCSCRRVHNQQPMPPLDTSRYRLDPPAQVRHSRGTRQGNTLSRQSGLRRRWLAVQAGMHASCIWCSSSVLGMVQQWQWRQRA